MLVENAHQKHGAFDYNQEKKEKKSQNVESEGRPVKNTNR